ncbi:MAG TPA: hypothetical protein ENH48_11695 [Halieaceae bacterium]|nr:MAG: hypothetical protein DRQ98_02430 [Gammaproteobacteria bacterium]HDY83602.1 hypothetical protein [Halieaceae bacterium]
MHHRPQRKSTLLNLLAFGLLLLPFGSVATGAETQNEAPIFNLRQVSPAVALAGRLNNSALATIEAENYAAVIDLRTPPEGVAAEQQMFKGTGIEYINIPVGGELPEAATIRTFNDTMDRLEGKKILIHCQSGNRVGMMWGVYLTSKGAPLDEVLEVVKYSATKEPMLAAIRQYAAETNSATSLCATC